MTTIASYILLILLAGPATGETTLMPLDTVLGMSVLDARGKPAGKIRDFIIDPQSGRLRYALIGGSRTGNHIVPWGDSAPAAGTDRQYNWHCR